MLTPTTSADNLEMLREVEVDFDAEDVEISVEVTLEDLIEPKESIIFIM